jgi:nucleotide-binding universal stress UspA family protein
MLALTEIKTILYATDLNSEAEAALSMTMSLAEKYQAEVTFLNVVEPINVSVYGWGAVESWIEIEESAVDRSQKVSEQKLNDFCDNKLPKGTAVSRPTIKVISGHAAKSILDYANEINADLIVLGSNAHGVIGELLLGSVADKVVRLSKRPVLLIPILDK